MNIVAALKRRFYAIFARGERLPHVSVAVAPLPSPIPLLPLDVIKNHIFLLLLENALKTRRHINILTRVCHWAHDMVNRVDERITVEYAFTFQPEVSPYRIPTDTDFSHFPNVYAVEMLGPIIPYQGWSWCNEHYYPYQQRCWTWDTHFDLCGVNAPNEYNEHGACRILEYHHVDEIARIVRQYPPDDVLFMFHLVKAEFYRQVEERLVRTTQTMIQTLKTLLRDAAVPDDCRILSIRVDPVRGNNFMDYDLLPFDEENENPHASGNYIHSKPIPFNVQTYNRLRCTKVNVLFASWTAGSLRQWFKPSNDVYDKPPVSSGVRYGRRRLDLVGQFSVT